MRWLIVLTLAVGCQPEQAPLPPPLPVPLGLSTDRTSYAPGDSLRMRLLQNAPTLYNLCHAQVERQEQGQWTPYRGEHRFVSGEDRELGVEYVCNDMAYSAGPGRVSRYSIRLSDRLPPGTYRFRAGIEREGLVAPMVEPTYEKDTLSSLPFAVE